MPNGDDYKLGEFHGKILGAIETVNVKIDGMDRSFQDMKHGMGKRLEAVEDKAAPVPFMKWGLSIVAVASIGSAVRLIVTHLVK